MTTTILLSMMLGLLLGRMIALAFGRYLLVPVAFAKDWRRHGRRYAVDRFRRIILMERPG